MSAGKGMRPYANNFEHLEDELRWLDLLIRSKCRSLPLQNQTSAETQLARAAYITPAEAEWLLDRPVASGASSAEAAALLGQIQQLRARIDQRVERTLQQGVFLALPQLCRLFGLSGFERQAVLICLAPELRRKYDRLYAYLQDDITRKRPSVDLVLDLLCVTEPQRWTARARLSESSPILRAGLLRTLNDPQSPSGCSGLAQFLQLDPRICEFLMGSSQIDSRLAGKVEFQRPARETGAPPVAQEISVGVFNLVEQQLNDRGRKLVVYLYGPYGVGKRELAMSVCGRLGCPILTLDTELLLTQGADAESVLRAAFREGLLQQAVIYLRRGDVLLQNTARPLLTALATAIVEYGWLVFVGGEAAWTLTESFPGCVFQPVKLPIPDVPLREAVWETCLATHVPNRAGWAPQLARTFRLTPGQIHAAVEQAENRRRMAGEARSLSLDGLSAACRQQSDHKLSELAVKIEPHYGWKDIVLPEDVLLQLLEICAQVSHQYTVFGTWGFGNKLNHGKGLSALFAGPSGTGKTMAAEVLAHELKLDLYKVDLSGVVSKYIGETEKNLSRIFAEAETSNAILFFDEADALFGKRTEVSDAHDRYANIETSYLLQKMEEYEGIVILATNLRENMDDAFTRRVRFVVEFPFPDEANRRQIWQTQFPQDAPVSPDVDYGYLAREFEVAGGSIKNIVLNAAFTAAAAREMNSNPNDEEAAAIGMREILHGTQREFAKIGKLWSKQIAHNGGIRRERQP